MADDDLDISFPPQPPSVGTGIQGAANRVFASCRDTQKRLLGYSRGIRFPSKRSDFLREDVECP
jgi:hypothetical protein